MKVALEVWSARYDEVVATCRLAEHLGLDGFYYGESPHGLNLDCWTTLAGLAAVTERIRLGPVITNVLPAYRSTVLLAKQSATVAALAEGRVDFRTGVGAAAGFARPWWEPFGIEYPDYDRRLSDLDRALGELPGLWADGPGPTAPLPITVAARGERAMALVARHADVWETSFATPSEFAAIDAKMTDLVGERPLVRSLEIDGFVSCTNDGLDRLLQRVNEDRGAEEDLGPVFERALVGTPEVVATQLRALAGAGVDQVVVALHDPHNPDALEATAQAASLI